MTGFDAADKVLWMADCYVLAKRFPDPATWLSLLQWKQRKPTKDINPLNYWLWMEIWKAAQNSETVTAK